MWDNREDSTGTEDALTAAIDRPGAAVRIGVAGWDYPDWRGPVYPERPDRGFDPLAWIARFVDVVEVNSTFYRPVAPRRAAGWVDRIAHRSRFRFAAKAHRSWTHESGADLSAEVPRTLEGLAPIRDAARLEAVVVQFPQRVHAGDPAFDRLARIADLARGWPLVVEVRHRSWAAAGAIDRIRRLGLAWCVVDQPDVPGTIRPFAAVTSEPAYVRLHGRNRADWFREGAGRDARYDYLYTDDEIDGVAGLVERLAPDAESVVVVQNNHFRGQALVNALQLRRRVEGSPPLAPAALVRAYPALAAECVSDQDRLF